jgi:hypothetical protein
MTIAFKQFLGQRARRGPDYVFVRLSCAGYAQETKKVSPPGRRRFTARAKFTGAACLRGAKAVRLHLPIDGET